MARGARVVGGHERRHVGGRGVGCAVSVARPVEEDGANPRPERPRLPPSIEKTSQLDPFLSLARETDSRVLVAALLTVVVQAGHAVVADWVLARAARLAARLPYPLRVDSAIAVHKGSQRRWIDALRVRRATALDARRVALLADAGCIRVPSIGAVAETLAAVKNGEDDTWTAGEHARVGRAACTLC